MHTLKNDTKAELGNYKWVWVIRRFKIFRRKWTQINMYKLRKHSSGSSRATCTNITTRSILLWLFWLGEMSERQSFAKWFCEQISFSSFGVLQMEIAYRTHNYLLILRFSEKPKTFRGIVVYVPWIFTVRFRLFILIPFYFRRKNKIRTIRWCETSSRTHNNISVIRV